MFQIAQPEVNRFKVQQVVGSVNERSNRGKLTLTNEREPVDNSPANLSTDEQQASDRGVVILK